LLDPSSGTVVRVAIETPSAAPQTARRFVDATDLLETYAPSPDGKALALVSRGHAYTMPLWEAAVSELGAGSSARRRAVTWLHDGARVAYVDDSAGYERIAIEDVDQTGAPAYVTTEEVGRITELVASPCGDRIAFANHRHELFVLDLGGKPRKLDASAAWRCIDLAFSPDGKWLAYVVSPKSSTMIVLIADCESGAIARLGSRRQVPLLHLGARLQPDLRCAAVRPEFSACDAAVRRDVASRCPEPVRRRLRAVAPGEGRRR
jgi:tricorn protease